MAMTLSEYVRTEKNPSRIQIQNAAESDHVYVCFPTLPRTAKYQYLATPLSSECGSRIIMHFLVKLMDMRSGFVGE